MKKNFLFFLVIYSISLGQLAQAQAPAINSFNPARNAKIASVGTNMAITLDQPMSTGATTLGALRLFSHQHGGQLHNGLGEVTTTSGNTMSFKASTDFKPGETIFTPPTSQVQSSSNRLLAHGLVNQSTTQVGGTGQGNFQAYSTTSVGNSPQDIRVGDLNNDGNLDLVVANFASNSVSIRLGTGTGTFTTPASGSELPAPNLTLGVSIGDIDNDGDLDLLAAGSTTVNVYLNNGSASFGVPTAINFSVSVSSLTVGDVDSDGDLDFVVANTDALGTGSTASLRLNDGNGQFTSPAMGSTITLGSGPVWVALHDMDSDGDLDLLATNIYSNSLSVRLNNGSGQFTAPATNAEVATESYPNVFSVGDIDGDGDLDVAVGNGGSNTASILANDGSGHLTALTTVSLGSQSQSVALGDVDSDGDLDLISANSLDNTISVRLNNGSGQFTPPSSNADPAVGGTFPVVVMLADVDKDGDLDALTNNFNSNNVSVLLNQSFPLTLTDFLATPDPLCVGSRVTFTANVGNLTGSYNYTLTNGISTTTGTSSSSGFSQTLTASESGIQTYSLTVSSSGQFITETYDLSVSELPVPTLSASHQGVITCSQTSVTLTAGGGDDYLFSGPGIVSQDPENGIAVVNLGGVYSVTVTNSEVGCFNTTTAQVVSFTDAPEISLIASSTTLTCTNPSVDLTVEGDGDVLWSTGSTSAVTSVSTAGTYSVTLTNANGCSSMASVTVSANQSAPSVSINPSSTTLTNASPTASLTAVGTGTYRWSTGATTQIISVSASGTYSVTLTSPGGCTASASVGVAGADLTVTLDLPQANFGASGTASVGQLVVNVFEVGGLPTSSGNVTITITAPIGYTISFAGSLSSINVSGGEHNPVAVDNPQWTLVRTLVDRQLTLTMNSGAFISGGGESSLGFSLTRTSANSGSTANITVNVADDLTMSYDGNLNNNGYARIISGL